MSPEKEEVREVYARFGLAVYAAQCLEHGLVNAFIYLDLLPNKRGNLEFEEWGRLVDVFAAEHFEHTLGKMISHLKTLVKIPPTLTDSLSDALSRRNWLIHHYFRERATDFLSSSGRIEMIKELDKMTEIFRNADALLEELFEPVREKYGITDEALARSEADLRSRLPRE
jgi:hypothetical protein